MQKLSLSKIAALFLGGFGFLAITASTEAANLLDVYKQALGNDPTFKGAYAEWQATRQRLPIYRASLLPQAGLTTGVGRGFSSTEPNNDQIAREPNPPLTLKNNGYFNDANYQLSISETLFNYSDWKQLAGASDQVKSAEATYFSASQDLILRVATAYFDVLQAEDVLRYTLANKEAIKKELDQASERYRVGLISITAYYNAKASYDQAVASEISARNTLADNWEKLWEITGNKYAGISPLIDTLPLISPDPENIDSWVQIAEKQNYSLQAAYYNQAGAREAIFQSAGGHLPTVSLNGNYSYDYNQQNYTNVPAKKTSNDLLWDSNREKTATVGLNLNFPIYQGGLVSAQTTQAHYLYDQATSAYEQTYRSTVSGTRQSYLSVIALINKIKADRQTIISNESSFKATEASYRVGLNTMVDVLQAQSSLYQAQQTFASDEYDYLKQILALKFNAGTLSYNDLASINRWLKTESTVNDQNDKVAADNSATTPTKTSAPSSSAATAKKQLTPTKEKDNAGEKLGQPDETLTTDNNSAASTKSIKDADPSDNVATSLRENNPAHYTLALYDSDNATETKDFLKKYQINDEKYIVLNYKNSPRYMIIHGNYATRDLALKAKDYWQRELPQSKTKIYIFAELQDHLKQT